MATIEEGKFVKLCEDLFDDRKELAGLVPGMAASDAALWILYGSLLSLLDVPPDYEPHIPADGQSDLYRFAVSDILQGRMSQPFDAGHYIDELTRRIKEEDSPVTSNQSGAEKL